MALAAAQVVDAVAARVPAAAGGVHTSRAWPLATLPAWRVTAEAEDVRTDGLARVERHDLSIAVAGHAEAAADLDDELHTLAASALTSLFVEPVPHGLELTGITRELATEGQATVGRITLNLRATFHVVAGAPETLV